MMKRLKYSLILTLLYLAIANIGNLFFDKTHSVDWTSTLWEAIFFFLFILLIQRYRK